jgi:hypothetical protein
VRNAIIASAARAAARTPALADLVRKEQDLRKQILAQAALIGNLLAEPPEQDQGETLKTLQQEQLRNQRQAAKRDIEKRFPEYASLISPVASTSNDIQAALKPDEALLSFLFGDRDSFVWAVPKQGPIAFAVIPLTASQIDAKISRLREALEPESVTVGSMPAFDVAAAHELYKLLLRSVEDSWRPAKSLIVITNGALGLLPLAVLPTEPWDLKPETEGEPYFARYRAVPWLAPSCSSFRAISRSVAYTAGFPTVSSKARNIHRFW